MEFLRGLRHFIEILADKDMEAYIWRFAVLVNVTSR